MAADDELRELFAEELKRHLATLDDEEAPREHKRRALHAIKGAAAMVGEIPLADALGRLERRLRDEDPSALVEASEMLRIASQRAAQGAPAMSSPWPMPPADLAPRPSRRDALSLTFEAEMRDRLVRLDDAIAGRSAPATALSSALRELHAIKGAATAMSDEALAWFCHGLEEHLAAFSMAASTADAGLAELARFRDAIADLVMDSEGALRRLRGEKPTRQASARARLDELDEESRDSSVRIPRAALDRLVDRIEQVGLLGTQLAVTAGQARTPTRTLRQASAMLAEALRLIGPPKPWGAPAASLSLIARAAQLSASTADLLEGAAIGIRDTSDDVLAHAQLASADLRELRSAPVSELLERIRHAIEAQAAREKRDVTVQVLSNTFPLDRHLSEQLMDPLLQLARNALAHSFEPAEQRVTAGKPRAGTLTLSALLDEDRLRLVVEDDGAGVDTHLVRARAITLGLLPADVALELDDEALLDLIFAPGFTTRSNADLLAGRGRGLDLVSAAVRRLGGAVHLSSSSGRGVRATLDLPVEPGLLPVLWVMTQGSTYAIPARAVAQIDLPAAGEHVLPLATLLGASVAPRPPLVLCLHNRRAPEQPARIGVDEVCDLSSVAIRSCSPLVMAAGPYRGAAVRANGRLHLVLDVDGLIGTLP